MPNCGSQIIFCDLPIRFDTYKGCSHGCKYCFVYRKKDISKIEKNETVKALSNFIAGKRTKETNWCDWDIPLHWGGMSDPFQPIEKKEKNSLECLKYLVKTQYPFVVSTKGKLIIEKEYLELIAKSNCVVQISAVCSKYDYIEQGAPSFIERLEMIKKVANTGKRVIVRVQPYFREIKKDLLENLEKFKTAGAYGITIEGMKFIKKQKNLIRLGSDYVYHKNDLERDFIEIKAKCKELGLTFYCAENRLRKMGENLCCCGVDGIEGFKVNEYNKNHINNLKPTEKMKEKGTAKVFSSLKQTTISNNYTKEKSFLDVMNLLLNIEE